MFEMYIRLVLVSSTFQNFHTNLVLILGPRLTFGWYICDIKIDITPILPNIPIRLISIQNIVSNHVGLVGSLILKITATMETKQEIKSIDIPEKKKKIHVIMNIMCNPSLKTYDGLERNFWILLFHG